MDFKRFQLYFIGLIVGGLLMGCNKSGDASNAPSPPNPNKAVVTVSQNGKALSKIEYANLSAREYMHCNSDSDGQMFRIDARYFPAKQEQQWMTFWFPHPSTIKKSAVVSKQDRVQVYGQISLPAIKRLGGELRGNCTSDLILNSGWIYGQIHCTDFYGDGVGELGSYDLAIEDLQCLIEQPVKPTSFLSP